MGNPMMPKPMKPMESKEGAMLSDKESTGINSDEMRLTSSAKSASVPSFCPRG